MAAELFTQSWIEAWCQALQNDTTYNEAAKNWQGAIIFTMLADAEAGLPEDRSVYLDLSGGNCHGGRIATPDDFEAAPYVVTGEAAAWMELLEGQTDPLMSLMSGKLRLTKGNMMSLIPRTAAARALLQVALKINDAA